MVGHESKPASLRKERLGWILWLVVVLGICLGLWSTAFGNDPRLFMPGPSTAGHYQIEQDCAACHTPEGGVDQKRCLACHQAELEAAMDAHPKKKFTDPRNADRLLGLDAMRCVTCHTEHRPDITHGSGVTLPMDYCQHCHSDIGDQRPTHKNLPFTGCATAGCHNYHDNRVLNESFLAKHLDEPAHLPNARMPDRDALVRWVTGKGQDRQARVDAPINRQNATITEDWHGSAHARAGVSCSDCHTVDRTGSTTVWMDRPNHERCMRCHSHEVAGWLDGKHGMRLSRGLSPMTPGESRLPMRAAVAHQTLDCSSCHGAHRYDTVYAQVDACLTCHADQHSLAYRSSPHYSTWKTTVAAKDPAAGVSCASCHMPRIARNADGIHDVVVEHDQNAHLRPVETMAQVSCLRCHGLGYSLDALADPALIRSNFATPPSVHVPSLDWVKQRVHDQTNP